MAFLGNLLYTKTCLFALTKEKNFFTENFKYSTNPIFRWKLYFIKHLIVSRKLLNDKMEITQQLGGKIEITRIM